MQNETQKPIKISDRPWQILEPMMWRCKTGNRGRPRADARSVIEGILYILVSGVQWKYLPDSYPPKSTVFGWFHRLVLNGFFERLPREVAEILKEEALLDLEECYIDGMFVRATSGGHGVGIGKKGKGSKLMVIVEKNGNPVAVSVGSAVPHEVTRVDEVLEELFIHELPEHLIGDAAYDSDKLDQELAQLDIEMIAPHKRNRVAEATQDGRALRRYRRRYKIERFNSWIQNYRRVLVRHEKKLTHFVAMVRFACTLILGRNFTVMPQV